MQERSFDNVNDIVTILYQYANIGPKVPYFHSKKAQMNERMLKL